MLTLLTYPGTPTAFSLSPFCVKAAMLLARSGLPWQREDLSDPRKMPHQKLPVMKTPERLVADSDGIRDWLEEQGLDFDEGLSPQDRARARALTHMAEDHLYFPRGSRPMEQRCCLARDPRQLFLLDPGTVAWPDNPQLAQNGSARPWFPGHGALCPA